MAIDRPLATPEQSIFTQGQDGEPDLEIEIINPEAVSIETEDGGMIFDFDPHPSSGMIPHDANLAEYIDDGELQGIATDLVGQYKSDKESRSDWERTYIEGLDLLGLKHEDRTTPWDGACGVFHPLLTEAVIRFQSQSIQELFPAAGPAKTSVLAWSQKQDQAQRVQYLNYLLTERMTEYRTETERLVLVAACRSLSARSITIQT